MSAPTPAEIRKAGPRLSAADHAGTIRSFYPFWDTQVRPFLVGAVRTLPEVRFDFKPRPASLTARQLVLYLRRMGIEPPPIL